MIADLNKKIEEETIPICEIMGVNIAAINMKWLLNFTNKYIKELSGNYFCVSNVHTTVMASENEEYRMVQNGGALAIPDGGPLSVIGRKRGFKYMERTTGPSYMEEIFKISMEKGYRHFFYGSTEQTLRKMRKELKNKYPDLQVVGMYSPPFRKMTEQEDIAIVERINKEKPDFVWIGLGAPKQEIWMAQHKGKIHGLMIGVGAGFDFFSGKISRAPIWMQKNNLEWVYRLIQDPKRLFMRYLVTNTKFIWKIMMKRQ